jgi:hypothetical protein
MPHRPTHRFIASYKGQIAGVIVMATPNTFSNLLGKDNRDLEKLISRGACISWSPKNLGSSLIMFSINWMVKNTSFRFFTAYSDVEARELGTIYQACNFTYLGQNSGARYEFFDPLHPDAGWFSDRVFRKITSYKKYAVLNNIIWLKTWNSRDEIHWNKIPSDVVESLKQSSREHQDSCKKRNILPKHKYVYILGKNKKETKFLRNTFGLLNPDKLSIPYPKTRGPENLRGQTKNLIPDQELTIRPHKWWPSNNEINKKLVLENKIDQKILYSIKEVSTMYGISLWALYKHIESDPSFPCVNVGIKKRFLIHLKKFDEWLINRFKRSQQERLNLLSSDELMRA